MVNILFIFFVGLLFSEPEIKIRIGIFSKDKNAYVIKRLPLEKYLCGVVPCEVPYSWPLEALKAQAVIARTFALRNLNKHGKDHFDLCSDVCCQVYGGIEVEKESTNKAVALTKGEVLTYNNDLAATFYCSCCGGKTEDSSELWGQKIPYLKPISCPYCKGSPNMNWEKTLSKDFIEECLKKGGLSLKIKNISSKGETSSGRIKYILINNDFRIEAHRFRMLIGPSILRSTKIFEIKKNNSNFTFKGSGFGHGVGLCQWGAYGMASKGKTYIEILNFYYPGTKIETIEKIQRAHHKR